MIILTKNQRIELDWATMMVLAIIPTTKVTSPISHLEFMNLNGSV